jgi:hypothetical protein
MAVYPGYIERMNTYNPLVATGRASATVADKEWPVAGKIALITGVTGQGRRLSRRIVAGQGL